MKSVMEELYYGNIYPLEQIVPDNKDYRPLGEKLEAATEALKKTLNTEDAARLELMNSNSCELNSMTNYAAFSHGLRLGIMLMSEAFSGKAE